MWFAILLSELFERPKGKVLKPQEIKRPASHNGDLAVGIGIIGFVFVAALLAIGYSFP